MAGKKRLDLFDVLERNPDQISEAILLARPADRWKFVEGLLLTGSAEDWLLSELESILTRVADKDFLGAVLFLLFSHEAERYKEARGHLHHQKATSRINDSATKRFLQKRYGIPERYLQAHIELYRVGMTSIILKLPEQHAIKFLKYRYRTNPRIVSATKAYGDQFGNLAEFAPAVLKSSDYFIIMDFVPGKTLREEIEEAGPISVENSTETALRIHNVERFLKQLVAMLSILHDRQDPIVHMDLSPDNIIIRPSEVGRDPAVVLIDFGYNYVLQESFGTPIQILAAQVSVAPELNDSASKATGRSDLFSLGMLLLWTISGKVGDLSELEQQLENLWQNYPEFGGLIESLIDSDPENRLLGKNSTESDYEFITCRITSAFELFKSRIERPRGWRQLLSNLPIGLFGQYERVLELARQYRAISDRPELAKEVRRLLHYAIIAQGVHNLILAMISLYLLDDFGLLDLSTITPLGYLSTYLEIQDLSPGTWKENLSGRLVALSTSILATRYYQNIHSGVSARGVNASTEFWLRFNSFSFAFPVCWMMVRPSHWPFCYFIQCIPPAAANYMTWSAAKSSLKEIERKLHLPLANNSYRNFFDLYDSYIRNSFIYTASVLLAGVALAIGLAKDEKIYAFMVSIIINLGVLYVTACSIKAPTIRSNLTRLYNGCRRARMVRSRH